MRFFICIMFLGVVAQTLAGEVKTRNAADWPFSADSPWNTPIGSGARYQKAAEPCTRSLISEAQGAWINSDEWSHPIYRARASDPMVPIVRVESAKYVDFTEADVAREGVEQIRIHIPSNVQPALPLDSKALPTDAHLHIIDPTGRYVDEMWRAFPRKGGGWNVGHYNRTDLHGPGVLTGGVRAYGGSAVGGLIRPGELARGIPHALAMAQPNTHLWPGGPVWPANVIDDGGEKNYSGHYPMGQLAAIPADIDLSKLDPPLSPQGLAIGKALQDYGVYNVDSAGASTIYAEPSVEKELGEARDDMPRLWAMLRCVSNNAPASVGGGGTRRAPLAPVLGK
ncbi:MAG: hypothetical protein HYV97_01180 [Bdellovibrio sp.]|nr:hypothetical protein [Bdellovibrio sp.]